jgi:hypothetical protein
MSDANWYGEVFKTWQSKQLGPKPTVDQLSSIHKLGARPGKQALAIAMGLRDCGVTGSQIVMACGAPQLNKMRGLISDAYLKRLAAPMAANGHQVYKLEVTTKGKQRIARSEAVLAKQVEAEKATVDKPVKAKGAPVVKRAPKGQAPQKPISDTPITEQPTPVEVGNSEQPTA